MKRKIKYTSEPLGRVEVVADFLPSPDQLVLSDDGVKVTISLSKRSVDFFKAQADRSNTSYQRMIPRRLCRPLQREISNKICSGP